MSDLSLVGEGWIISKAALDHLERVDQELGVQLGQTRVRDHLSVTIVQEIHLSLDNKLITA